MVEMVAVVEAVVVKIQPRIPQDWSCNAGPERHVSGG
jgi:hypothetical protein